MIYNAINYIQGFLPNKSTFEQTSSDHANSNLKYTAKLAQTILLCPITTTAKLSFRTAKLLSWDLAKSSYYALTGYHQESASHLEREYLNTVKAVRDVLFLPFVAKRAFNDMVAKPEEFLDDIPVSHDYLTVDCEKSFQQFSSYLHGHRTFEVIKPKGIKEFPAASDGTLKTVMASHFLKPDMMAINFGSPNVAAFITKKGENDTVQTVKIDAKSLRRADMAYHPTNGKIQSGLFFVPTNLPQEALARFEEAAEKMKGRRDITCVNTNCRVLKEAGFSIENVEMDEIVFPNTFMEHLLYRNVFYTDREGSKHKVHFDILNTTSKNLEEYMEQVDTDVVGTRLRHRRRDADTEEQKLARGNEAKAIIALEKERLAQKVTPIWSELKAFERRQVTVSAPSFLGDIVAQIWGRHTIYEMDLSDKKDTIAQVFGTKLSPFPQKNPSCFTRIKKDFLFSPFMIHFLRGHMMGRADVVNLYMQDLLKHLSSIPKEIRLNYAILDDKVVFAKVNSQTDEAIKRAADWALSKHALIANRQDVYCAGEIWYDESQKCFLINDNSGTYNPSPDRVHHAAKLANEIFDSEADHPLFKVAPQIEAI